MAFFLFLYKLYHYFIKILRSLKFLQIVVISYNAQIVTHNQARSQDLFQGGGGQKLIDTRGVARILVRGGETSDKISSKVERISV